MNRTPACAAPRKRSHSPPDGIHSGRTCLSAVKLSTIRIDSVTAIQRSRPKSANATTLRDTTSGRIGHLVRYGIFCAVWYLSARIVPLQAKRQLE